MGYGGLGQEHPAELAPAPSAPAPSAPTPSSTATVDTQFVPTMRTLPERISRPEQPWRPERPNVTQAPSPWRSQDLFTRGFQPRPEARSFVPVRQFRDINVGPTEEELEAEQRAREFTEWQRTQQANLLQPHGQLPLDEQTRAVEKAAADRVNAQKELWKGVPPPHGLIPTVEVPTYRTIQEAEGARAERQAVPISTTPVSSVKHNPDGTVTDASGVTWFWGASGWETQERDGRSAPSWYKKETAPVSKEMPKGHYLDVQAQPESIWTQRGAISDGGKFTIRSGQDLDNPRALSEIRIDDALASAQWYDLYGRTPPERGGATPGEQPDVQRWRTIAFERYYELKSKGHTISPYWGAFEGFVDSIAKNPVAWIATMGALPLTLLTAKAFAEAPQTIDKAQETATLRTANMIDGGYNPYAAGFLAYVMGIGDLLPSNLYTEAVLGYDLTTGRELTWKERAWRGGMAILETGMWAIGGTKGKSFRLWTLPERAPITTLATDVKITGPVGKPMPVLTPVAAPAPLGYRPLAPTEKSLLEVALEQGETVVAPELLHTAEGSFIREGFRLSYKTSAAAGYGTPKVFSEPGIPDFKSGDWIYGRLNDRWFKHSAEAARKNWAQQFIPVTDAEAAAAAKAVAPPSGKPFTVPSIQRPIKPFTVPEPYEVPAEGGKWFYKYVVGQGWVRQFVPPRGIPGVFRPVLPKTPVNSMQFESEYYYYSLIKDQWWKSPKSVLEPGHGTIEIEKVTLEQALTAARDAGADDAIIGKIRQQWLKATQGGTWELDQIMECPPVELYKGFLEKWAKFFQSPQWAYSGDAIVMIKKKLPWNLPSKLKGLGRISLGGIVRS